MTCIQWSSLSCVTCYNFSSGNQFFSRSLLSIVALVSEILVHEVRGAVFGREWGALGSCGSQVISKQEMDIRVDMEPTLRER